MVMLLCIGPTYYISTLAVHKSSLFYTNNDLRDSRNMLKKNFHSLVAIILISIIMLTLLMMMLYV